MGTALTLMEFHPMEVIEAECAEFFYVGTSPFFEDQQPEEHIPCSDCPEYGVQFHLDGMDCEKLSKITILCPNGSNHEIRNTI